MIPFTEAYEIVMAAGRLLETERVALRDALHRVLAEDVRSDMDMPPFDKSAMDGYACRRSDLPGPLEVVESIQAGYVPMRAISRGQCSKIMTGAPIPEGADCVVMVEQSVALDGGRVQFLVNTTAPNICSRGEDIRAGDLVLARGTLLEPRHIAVLAATGCVAPRVYRRPRVGVIATGDELVEPDVTPEPSQIRTSNSYQICAQVRRGNAVPAYYGIARDTEFDLDAAMKRAMAENDVLIMSGGVSMGDFDLVPEVMRKNGFEIRFDSIAIKPGKPTTFGISATHWCFGLPGNPVSTYIQFEILIKPFLYRLAGHEYRAPYMILPLAAPLRRRQADREAWIPVKVSESGARACEFHGSAHIGALTEADGFVVMPTGISELAEGTFVRVRSI
jgi:molybdopterin molybdotransferase